jgi:signal transduction histidine kinase/CheY-like chemotaxis protein/HPt (histidine-containing phosphotransfer) domain-containing protein
MVFSRLSFRWKAIIGIALIEALTLSVTIAGGLRHMERVQSDLIERSARAALTLYSAAVSDALISRDIAKVEAVSQDLISRTEAVFVRVLDQDGRVVTALGEPSALSRPFAADDNPLSDEHDAYAVSAPLLAGSDRIGEVQLSIDNRRARSELSTARKLAAVVAVSGMTLAALFSWLLGGWLAAGVQRLSDGARRIASGGLDARVDEQGEKELRSLARTFNDMASALQARDAERSALLARAEQAVDEAREASRAKSAFLAAMSHEIRTPLNGVVGLARIIADNRQPELAGDFSRQLGIASEQLRMIVNDILDFSKIEAGRLELENIAFAVEDVAIACHALFGAQAKEKALELRVDIGRNVPYALSGDPTRLTQILSNYVSNAIKFTQAGHVAVAIAVLERTDDRVRLGLSVRDTGSGVSQQEVAALFEPFAQADASIVRSHGGTGLGLTICKRLAELMDGTVGGEGCIGSGAHFWAEVWLGIASDEALRAVRSSVETTSLADLRVLVVDDVAINRVVACHLVTRAGARAEQAENGRLAVERICAGGFDLVLMDIQMPVMDGKNATREIISRLGARAPKIVALTAHALAEERAECLALGMSGYLTKPIDMDALSQVLAQAAKGVTSGAGSISHRIAPPLLDVAGIASQFDEDIELYQEVLDASISDFAAMCESLVAALDGPVEALARQIHAIRGACLNLCFARAAGIAAELERALRAGALEPQALAAEVHALTACLRESESAARNHLASDGTVG